MDKKPRTGSDDDIWPVADKRAPLTAQGLRYRDTERVVAHEADLLRGYGGDLRTLVAFGDCSAHQPEKRVSARPREAHVLGLKRRNDDRGEDAENPQDLGVQRVCFRH
jgi:hypothetical protein